MFYCYFKFVSNHYSTCLLKWLRVTLFVGIVLSVRSLLWLSLHSTFVQPYKLLANMWLNSSFSKTTYSQNEWTPATIFFPSMDAIKNFGSFIIIDHWPHVKEFNLVVRIKSLVC